MRRTNVEILAPAGSFESLQTAINAGADAIYFGVDKINMRASAAVNFKLEDIDKIVEICKKKNVKSYLTLNVLLFDKDLEQMRLVMDMAKNSGVDAVIVADMAGIQYANQIGLEAHISTQLSISNIETVKFFSQFSDRLVLARELTLKEVEYICDQITAQDIKGPKGNLVEIEVFAHGALCVAFSGRCGMSLHCTNSSANLGKCSQICRRPYKVIDLYSKQELVVDNNYVMSSADLCTIGMLDKLLDTGVSVLKFEGRGKSPEYVDMVIKTYKNAMKSIEEGTYTQDKINDWNKDLGTVFNRGQSKGFYMGRNYAQWAGVHGSKATLEKKHLGEVLKYYPKIQVAQIVISAKETLHQGEEIIIIGKLTGTVRFTVKNIRLDENAVDEATQGQVITFKCKDRVRLDDKVYVMRKRDI